MKILLSILICFSTVAAIGQSSNDSSGLSPLIRSIAQRIKILSAPDSVCFVMKTEYPGLVRLLEERAKTYELLVLVEYPNPYVRVNAFNCLLTSGYLHFPDVLANHTEDQDSILYSDGRSSISHTTVAKQMAQLVTDNNKWIGQFPWNENDTKRLSEIIDKIEMRK